MAVDMSFDYNFSFGPATPPDYSYELAFQEASYQPAYRRADSLSSQMSMYSKESSPDTTNIQLATPIKSPIRQHGPLLLPKIRSQDQAIESPAKRVKKNGTAGTWRPGHSRSYTNPETISYMPAALATPSHSRSSSTLCSPISMTSSADAQFRRSSSCSLDGQTIGKYGFPTYRQMPTYISSTAGTETFVPAPYYTAAPPREPSPMRNSISFDDFCEELELAPAPPADEPTTTLQAFLTAPNPTPSLVRQLNIHVRDPASKHFWWDIRQIRPWTSFTSTTITSIPGLAALLTVALPASSLPAPSAPRTTHPETESELATIYTSFYAAKLNAALAVAQGSRHLLMRAPTPSSTQDASFVSNYTDDTSALIFGRGLGRVVGLVKSFDRWNSAMRVEGNHKRVAYLRGLAHLHRCMREHGCRYGFLMTEIELVVVRNGGEATPHFGYLEVASIPLAETGEGGEDGEVKMTALLALFYLHMLARDAPLAGQVGWKAEIGAPAEGTRRKCLPRDEWMPAPQLAEKREAKRARGWVWPEEAVGRKEMGKRGVRYAGAAAASGGV
ncbi:hypothetical protein V500_08340 [Pseudogymnoascus sp. VKM F-4518 (FW-2643)]|nr:hypothetical protein V500_08340 [Pseudogymnoascus sp. VKM F-4518 (FW-2643)]